MPVPIYNMQGKLFSFLKMKLKGLRTATNKFPVHVTGLHLPDQNSTSDPNVIAYQTNLQQAFLQSAMAQNIRIQQQLLAQNQAFQQLLLQQHVTVSEKNLMEIVLRRKHKI